MAVMTQPTAVAPPAKTSASSSVIINDEHIHHHQGHSRGESREAGCSREPLLVVRSGSADSASRGRETQVMKVGQSSFWNRRWMLSTVLIGLFLLSGTFALFDSLIDDDANTKDNGELGDEVELVSDDDAKGYLSRYGYIGSPSRDAGEPRAMHASPNHRTAEHLMGDLSLDSIRAAIRKFQEFAGLPASGELDVRTRKKMTQPRCGIQDVQMLTSGDYVMKWRKRRLTYQIFHYTDDLPENMQKRAIQMAFDAWSRHVPLEFSEASGYGGDGPDIRVQFARRSHNDPWPFDGRGGVLAHATFPQDGKLHFDDDENWAFLDGRKIANHRYTDLYWVALHEIGHVLGLSHSNIETAIMAPFYQDPRDLVDWRGNYKKPELTTDDVRAAQQIYGKRYGSFTGDGGSDQPYGSDRSSSPSSRGRTSGGGGRIRPDTYDDREGGFWSRLGKMFSGDEENNANDDGENGAK